MTIEVIGAGFGRTGTLSLKAALEQLGFGPCYHMYELLQNVDHAASWIRAHRDDSEAIRVPLDAYRSTVDWPGCGFWRELIELYPGALVVLSVRPAESWYDSFRDTVGAVLAAGQEEDPASVPPEFRPIVEIRDGVVRDRSFSPTFDLQDRTAVIAAYERHNDAVRSTVPAQRLLELDVAQGWDPLCSFLGVPVPPETFPRINDRKQFRSLFGLDDATDPLTQNDVDGFEQRFATGPAS
jgi:hypothetical protein